MPYYVCENRSKSRALVHEASCDNCQNGQGKRSNKGELPINGNPWFGPYESVDMSLVEARNVAKAAGLREARLANCCAVGVKR